jgi:uncharacterized surface protein with fasciclin (FAS1) repeats
MSIHPRLDAASTPSRRAPAFFIPVNIRLDCETARDIATHRIKNPAIQCCPDRVDEVSAQKQPSILQQTERDNTMKKTFLASMAATALAITTLTATAQDMKDPTVGGAAMYPSKTIVENAVNSPIHTTLVAAVKAAGLVDTLNSPGPFTVFAPTNDAFAKLPAGTVDSLVKPENKTTLTRILTYHVVPGRISAKDIAVGIKAGGGKYEMTTVEGGKLTATMSGKKIVLTDEKGGMATITTWNVYQSNGVIDVIDTVLMPS